MAAKVTPTLNVKDVPDLVLRRNFQNLSDYFQAQNQLLDFQFVEIIVSQAVTNQKIRHTLGYAPKDVIISRCTGPGVISFNYGAFDDETIDISTTGAIRVRCFIGSKAATGSEVGNGATDNQEVSSLANGVAASFTSVTNFVTGISGGSSSPGTITTTASLPKIVTVSTTSYTLDGTEDFVLIPDVGTTPQLTLPSAATATRSVTFIKTGNSFNAVSLNARSGQTIQGGFTSGGASSAAPALTKLTTFRERVTLVPDGVSSWQLMLRDYPRIWEPYTPVLGGGGTFTSNQGYWMRNGAGIKVAIVTGPCTASGAGGLYTWALPKDSLLNQLTVDSTPFPVGSLSDTDAAAMTLKLPVGAASVSNQAALWQWPHRGQLFLASSQAVAYVENSVTVDRANGAGSADGFAGVAATFSLNFEVPISGWYG